MFLRGPDHSMDYKAEYNRWLELADEELKNQLKGYDEKEIEDSFYRNLEFGTGGLRGIIGAGTNRMNVHTVRKASQGLANYLNKNFDNPSVVIGYDSRIKSGDFAKEAAAVFCANGLKVYLWPELTPVPTVSFAIRYLHASVGVMITASHNPGKYNGYKVYGADGCQITIETAEEILNEIEKIDIFSDVKNNNENSRLEYIKPEVLTAFIEEVKKQSVLFGEKVDKDVSIVYSPLNGTGFIPVSRILSETGYTNVTIVEEQKMPDGNFPTCPYPNPEIKDAMKLGIEYAKKKNADLFLATDPDCDRVGIAIRDDAGEYQLLTGNEVGLLLLDYICSQRVKHGRMPEKPIIFKTIVTTELAKRIADSYDVCTIDVLTGFKFIGEQIGYLEKEGKEDSFIFGFEESYGYLTGSYVRDKDGVNAVYMISEMFSFYKTKGISLLDRLKDIYLTYGYCLNTLHSYEFDGPSGFVRMKDIMNELRKGIHSIGGKRVIETFDFSMGINGLPKSDVIKYMLEEDCSVVVRPSGTEPKLKVYFSVSAKNETEAKEIESVLKDELCGKFLK